MTFMPKEPIWWKGKKIEGIGNQRNYKKKKKKLGLRSKGGSLLCKQPKRLREKIDKIRNDNDY